MKKIEQRQPDVRVEIVTTTFVAAGRPEDIYDLDAFIKALNGPRITEQITILDPAVRPLYRASDRSHLGAPLLVRREEIVFANFEGPSYATAAATQVETPVLLLAPPFQIQGMVAVTQGMDPTQALRVLASGFFAVAKAAVFDADGNALGEGEQIIVNGAAVQMTAATAQHIELAAAVRPAEIAVAAAPASAEADIAAEAPARRQRAA